MRLPACILICAVLCGGPASAGSDGGLTAEQAAARATESHPAVVAARLEVASSEAALRGAGAPTANPAVELGAGARFTAAGPAADVSVGLEVPLPVGGAPGRVRQRESASLDAARARLRWVELQVGAAARVAWAEARAAEERQELAEQTVELGRRLESAALRRHQLGEASVLESNAASLDRARSEAALAAARAEAVQAAQALREALAMDGGAELRLAEGGPPSPGPLVGEPVDALVARALEARRDLEALRAAAGAARAELRATQAGGVPDLEIGLGWAREGSEAQLVGGSVRFELPFQRDQVAVARAAGGAERAAVDAARLDRAVSRDVRAAIAAFRAAEEVRAATRGEALALAEANLRLVVRAYETGEDGLPAVLAMQRQALEARGAAIDADRGLAVAAARLELALGGGAFVP